MASLRCLLISLKFLSAHDVLQSSAVSHCWHSASESDELWLDLLHCQSEGLLSPSLLQNSPSMKDLYRQLYTQIFVPTIVGKMYMQYYVGEKREDIRTIRQTKLTKGSYLLMLPDMSLFACGGDINSEAFYDYGLTVVYRIHPVNDEVEDLPEMMEPRRYPCSYFYQGTVYVFGGANGTTMLNTAEEYSISKRQWGKLPSMKASRCSTTPCMNGNKIYLIGGYPSNTGETFDVKERRFELLTMTLPGTADCVAAIIGEHLHVFTMRSALTFSLSGNPPLPPVPINTDNYVWSHSKPVIHKGTIWFYYWHRQAMAAYSTANSRLSQTNCTTYEELRRRNIG